MVGFSAVVAGFQVYEKQASEALAAATRRSVKPFLERLDDFRVVQALGFQWDASVVPHLLRQRQLPGNHSLMVETTDTALSRLVE